MERNQPTFCLTWAFWLESQATLSLEQNFSSACKLNSLGLFEIKTQLVNKKQQQQKWFWLYNDSWLLTREMWNLGLHHQGPGGPRPTLLISTQAKENRASCSVDAPGQCHSCPPWWPFHLITWRQGFMDYLPDLVFVRGTSSFRRLQELTLVKILFVAHAFSFWGDQSKGSKKGDTPDRRALKTPLI